MRLSVLVVFGLLVAGCGPDSVVVNMGERGGSGENGTAIFTDRGDTVDVQIQLTPPSNDNGSQPAKIYKGTCGNLGAPEFTLTSVINGQSTTTALPIAITQLRGAGLAVRVGNSITPAMDESCGNLP